MKKVLVIIIVGLLGVIGYLMDQNVKLKEKNLEYYMNWKNLEPEYLEIEGYYEEGEFIRYEEGEFGDLED